MKKLYFLSTMMLIVMATMLPQVLKAGWGITTHVTSFGTYDFSGKHFCILSNMENISSDDVEFKEYAKYISYSFQIKGGIEVPSQSEKVEVCILLSYDIKDASYIRTVSEPVWGNTSVSSVTTSKDFKGNPRYNYHYNFGVVGYTQSEQKVNLYNRYIDLFAYEISTKEGAEQKMIWKAYVKSQGSSDNLYEIFPAMAYSLEKYIGTTTADGVVNIDNRDRWAYRYQLFEKGLLHLKNTTLGKFCNKKNKNNGNGCVLYIIKTKKYTRVCIYFSRRSRLFKDFYIEYNHQKYPLKAINNSSEISLDSDMPNSNIHISDNPNNVIYKTRNWYDILDLYFPPLPEDANVIDLISQKRSDKRSNEDFVWKGIQLKN